MWLCNIPSTPAKSIGYSVSQVIKLQRRKLKWLIQGHGSVRSFYKQQQNQQSADAQCGTGSLGNPNLRGSTLYQRLGREQMSAEELELCRCEVPALWTQSSQCLHLPLIYCGWQYLCRRQEQHFLSLRGLSYSCHDIYQQDWDLEDLLRVLIIACE